MKRKGRVKSMVLVLVVTHPHRDLCGDITHWEPSVILTIDHVDQLDTYVSDAETVWTLVQQHGSFGRATGRPYYPVWLGTYGEMGSMPETSTTADWVWRDAS